MAGVPVPGIKVIKLLFGLIPYKTVWEIAVPGDVETAHEKMVTMLTGHGDSGVEHPLDAVIHKLRTCWSCQEAARVLRQAAEAAGLKK